MKTFYTISKIFLVSFLMALTAYAQEQQDCAPPEAPSAEMKARFEEKLTTLKTTCATDIAALCADADGHRLIRCLKESKQSLTEQACQEAVAQLPNRQPRPPRDAE